MKSALCKLRVSAIGLSIALASVVVAAPVSVDEAPRPPGVAAAITPRVDVEGVNLPEVARLDAAASAAAERRARIAAMSERERKLVARVLEGPPAVAPAAPAAPAALARPAESGFPSDPTDGLGGGAAADSHPSRAAPAEPGEGRAYAGDPPPPTRTLADAFQPDQRNAVRDMVSYVKKLMRDPLVWFIAIPVLLGVAALSLMMSRRG